MSIADSAEAAGAFFELAGTVGGENLLVSRVGALWAWTRRSCCECGYPGGGAGRWRARAALAARREEFAER